jgi:glutamate synthase (NADPH) small chain
VYAGGDIVTGAATVIQAMGAGRKAARGMKAWLGLRDPDCTYSTGTADGGARLFGIDPNERNYVRVRVG